MASLIQSAKIGAGSATTVALQIATSAGNGTVDTTPGSLIIAYVGSSTPGRNCSASDNVNGAYNTDVGASGGSSNSICSFPNNGGGPLTVTGAISGAATAIAIIVEEWSGIAAIAPFDKASAIASGTAVTTLTSNSTGTLSQANELVVTACRLTTTQGSGSGQPTAQAPFTPDPIGSIPANTPYLGVGYQIVGSTAAVTSQFNWTTSSNCNLWVVTYKLATVGVDTLLGQGWV